MSQIIKKVKIRVKILIPTESGHITQDRWQRVGEAFTKECLRSTAVPILFPQFEKFEDATIKDTEYRMAVFVGEVFRIEVLEEQPPAYEEIIPRTWIERPV